MTNIKIVFSIFGDDFNPSEFSQLININSTESWYKGDFINNRIDLVRKETAWEYSTGFVATYYLEEVTKLILQKFSNYTEIINKYADTRSLNIKLFVIAEIINDETPALYFDCNLIGFLSTLKASIDIDLSIVKEF